MGTRQGQDCDSAEQGRTGQDSIRQEQGRKRQDRDRAGQDRTEHGRFQGSIVGETLSYDHGRQARSGQFRGGGGPKYRFAPPRGLTGGILRTMSPPRNPPPLF